MNRWAQKAQEEDDNVKRLRQKNLNSVWGKEADKVMKQVSFKKLHPKKSWTIIAGCLLEIALYVLGGWLFFGFRYGWTFIDCYYFAMVTVSTVGYGDLTPDGLFFPDQIAVIVYALIGVAVMTESLSKAASVASAKFKKMAAKAKAKTMQRSIDLVEAASEGGQSSPLPDRNLNYVEEHHETFDEHQDRVSHDHFVKWLNRTVKPLSIILLELILCWSLGGVLLVLTEGVPFSDGFYCAIITSLSIGYGEISPVTHTSTARPPLFLGRRSAKAGNQPATGHL
jgi:hypothetical protein